MRHEKEAAQRGRPLPYSEETNRLGGGLDAVRIDLDARAHRAGQRDAAQIGSLRGGGFRAHDGVEQG